MIAIVASIESQIALNHGTSLRRQPSINSRQPLRQGQHVIDDRVADLAVQILQFTFRFTIDRDAERRDAGNLRLAQGFTGVVARVSGIAVVVIVRAAV